MSKGTQRFLIFLVLMVAFIVIGQAMHFEPDQIREFLRERSPILASVIFIGLYVVGTFFVWVGPKDVLRIASALVFGAAWSSIVVYIGEMLNLVVMFFFSRKLGRSFVESKMKGKMEKLDQTVSNTSSPTIFFMKFYPFVPFRFLDLGYGLTQISFKRYLLVSAIAAPVRVYAIQWFLALGLGTALNPVELQTYLMDRPKAMLWTAVYFISAFVYLLILIFRPKRRGDIQPEC